eukprot:jgi/Mesvir1/9308/Mv06290-RA.1
MDYLNTVPTVLNAKLLKLADFPQVGKAVTEIDVTGNKISTLPPSLPDTLKSLTITGNFISALPSYLSRLPSLEVLHASTNCIKDADIIFRCPALLHASLAYNSIARLALPTEALAPGGTSSKPGSSSTASRPQRSPSPTKAPTGHPNGMPPPSKPGAVVPISSQLKLVNLSHNDLVDLRGTLRALSCLPCLVSLLLVGNPLVLCEGYRTRTASALPSLEQLDGCKVAERDDASGNAESSGSGGADRGSNDAKVELRISLTGLETPPPPPPQAATGESGDGSKSARKDEKGGKAAASSGAKKDAGKGKDAGAGGKKGAKGHPKEEEAEPMELPPPVSYAVRLLLHKGTEPVTSAEVPPKPLEADEPPKEEGAEPVVEAPLLEHDDVFPVGVPVRNVLRGEPRGCASRRCWKPWPRISRGTGSGFVRSNGELLLYKQR